MITIAIVDTLSFQLKDKYSSDYRFIATRPMSRAEIVQLKNSHVRRFYLPVLPPEDQEAFFSEFDRFWESLVKDFDKNHLFWRRALSSKMQEWEHSLGYFLLILFSLTKLGDEGNYKILFICERAHVDFVSTLAKNNGWDVSGFKGSKNGFSLKAFRSMFLYLKQVLSLIYKKIISPSINVKNLVSEWNHSSLLVSFFYPQSLKSQDYNDPFWGGLEKRILKMGGKVFYLSDSLVRLNWKTRKKLHNIRLKNVFLPYSFLKCNDILKIILRPLKRIYVSSCCFMGKDVSLVVESFLNKPFCRFSFLAESFYFSITRICDYIQFENLFIVFEGNNIERACIQAFRKKCSAQIKGYSQGVLYPLNLKLHRTITDRTQRPEPDIFISTGPYAKKLFTKISNCRNSIVKDGCSLRDIPKMDQIDLSMNTKYILVALDGINSAVSLLDWICENQSVLQGYRVVLRAHPNVPLAQVQSQMINIIPDVFEISHLSLLEDIQRCDCVLYRHCSVGMHALLNGKVAIHLAVDSPLSGDPIEELQYGKFVADSASTLLSVLKTIYNMPLEEKKIHIKKAQAFVSSCFARPSEENIQSFIGQ